MHLTLQSLMLMLGFYFIAFIFEICNQIHDNFYLKICDKCHVIKFVYFFSVT